MTISFLEGRTLVCIFEDRLGICGLMVHTCLILNMLRVVTYKVILKPLEMTFWKKKPLVCTLHILNLWEHLVVI